MLLSSAKRSATRRGRGRLKLSPVALQILTTPSLFPCIYIYITKATLKWRAFSKRPDTFTSRLAIPHDTTTMTIFFSILYFDGVVKSGGWRSDAIIYTGCTA